MTISHYFSYRLQTPYYSNLTALVLLNIYLLRSPRRGCAAARLLGLRVQTPTGTWKSPLRVLCVVR